MPELPEVETIVQGLSRHLVGNSILHVDVRCAQIIRGDVSSFCQFLAQKKIERVSRHGKTIFVMFFKDSHLNGNGGHVLKIHLGMTGQLVFEPSDQPPNPYTHLIFKLDDSASELRYRDMRKFGHMALITDENVEPAAPDAWTSSEDKILAALKDRRGMIKHALLNQHVIAGLGNIYVDEGLHRARIHPQRTLESLSPSKLVHLVHAMCDVLAESIKIGGTSFRNYIDTEGKRGGFKERLQVYGKGGRRCHCGALIHRIVVAGRGTHFCPKCQRAPSK